MTLTTHPTSLGPNAELALQTILGRPTQGIPNWLLHVMEHSALEHLAGVEPGSYVRDPVAVYLAKQRRLGTCMIDQWIPENPLTMGQHGYQSDKPRGVTQGAEQIVVDGILIDSPEAVVEHMERIEAERWQARIDAFDHDATAAAIVERERQTQQVLGPDILKAPYGVVHFPRFDYSKYGYEGYFMAYALYPESIERRWRLQAEFALRHNRAAADAYRQGKLPPLCRLDHDMADSRGTLVDVRSLDRLWFPLLAQSIAPLLDSGVRLIWHCDGNLMQMVPRLIDAGISGFQGFQYEDGMDYRAICAMKARDGRPLLIIAGASVTRTLVHGSPDDVRQEVRYLVEHGPRTGLFLGGSSSIAPATPLANILALADVLRHFREQGRTS